MDAQSASARPVHGWINKKKQRKSLYGTAIIVTVLAWFVGGGLIAKYF